MKYVLEFKQPAGTSRGVLKTKDTYFLLIEKDGKQGVGECGILRGLSADDRPDYEDKLTEVCKFISKGLSYWMPKLGEFPSIQFGLEQAFRDLYTPEPHSHFDTFFSRGEEGIPINGLIWMGEEDFMKEQIEKRLEEGFSCLKMKIGAIQWEKELEILKSIRQRFGAETLELRVDANGGFTMDEAQGVLHELHKLKVHSIEQPIEKGQWESMRSLCQNTPVPIALDEELIGVHEGQARQELLDAIEPQFIILKPSFIGGWRGSRDWITRAEKKDIGWWVTSALESNIGLNAIAEWTSTLNVQMPQGLGTGSLYTNNLEGPLHVHQGHLVKVNREWQVKFSL